MNTRAKHFYESEKGASLREELMKMTKDPAYSTKSMYSTHDKDGMSFVEKHMKYMSQFPDLNCEQYISNLKLMTKIKK